MIERISTITPALCAMVLLGACLSPQPDAAPKTQSIDFARGCWINRTPEPGRPLLVSFLRLLPPATSADSLEGQIQYSPPPKSGNRHGIAIALSRDGSTAHWIMEFPDQTATRSGELVASSIPQFAKERARGKSWKQAAWSSQQGQLVQWLVIEGDGEQLKISTTRGGGWEFITVTHFDGVRDGCD